MFRPPDIGRAERSLRWAWVLFVCLTAVSAPTWAQIYVYPRRPGTSQVRYDEFAWRYVDLRRGVDAEGGPSWQRGPRLHRVGGEALPDPWNPASPWDALPLAAAPRPDSLRRAAGGGQTQDLPSAAALPPALRRAVAAAEPARLGGAAGDAARLQSAPAQTAADRRAKPATSTLAMPSARDSGGIRLYFYERERVVAERAAAAIAAAYDQLAVSFDFFPTQTVPFFLYNTYYEFLQTNLFPVQEGVLGVTSTRSLEMALPYFGDHRRFVEVATHEMAHEFTIQKVRWLARQRNAGSDPLGELPLWFIEGLAEYYAHGGLDPETEMLVRDLVLNPDASIGYVLTDFFVERGNFLWTYKLGQARCAFLESVYGAGFIQRVLDASIRLVSVRGSQAAPLDVAKLFEALSGDSRETMRERFESWLKQRAYPAFLASVHRPEHLAMLKGAPEFIQAQASSPDGNLLLHRTVDPRSGQLSLRLLDHRAPMAAKTVAQDGSWSVESLHPVSERNFALGASTLAYIARFAGRDVIYWHSYEYSAERHKKSLRPVARPGTIPGTQLGTRPGSAAGDAVPARRRSDWKIQIQLGSRRRIQLAALGIVAADSIALSPDERHVAFTGVDRGGRRDLFVVAQWQTRNARLVRVTGDVYAEREVTWGPGGIVYTSDATEHGKHNLFAVKDFANPRSRPLAAQPSDQFDPLALADGGVLFAAYDGLAANLYEATETGRLLRRSRAVTGLYDVAVAPGGDFWVLHHHRGRRSPVRLKKATLLAEEVAVIESVASPASLETTPLDPAFAYSAASPGSWALLGLLGALGASGRNIFGQIAAFATDRLRNHSLSLSAQAYGSLSVTQASLFYINSADRTAWGAGLFQNLRFRLDETLVEEGILLTSVERFFGAAVIARYPHHSFLYSQVELAAGGVAYALLADTEQFLSDGVWNGTGRDLLPTWKRANAGIRPRLAGGLSVGYNTIRYHPATGPISGSSAMIEVAEAAQPFDPFGFASVRLDAEHYVALGQRANVFVRVGAGHLAGSERAPKFFLSSFDTLRGITFGDTERLIGTEFLHSTAELQFPLEAIIRIRLFDLEGIAAFDFGGTGTSPGNLWSRRVLDFATGVNLGLGPLVLRLRFAKPLSAGSGPSLPNRGDWVTNISLGYRYL